MCFSFFFFFFFFEYLEEKSPGDVPTHPNRCHESGMHMCFPAGTNRGREPLEEELH